jgi:hypothetical protein
MNSRETLSKWLYNIHNKVNEKLGVKEIPEFKDVWDRYESYRSKCTKSPEIKKKIEKGCTNPLKGFKKKCIITVTEFKENTSFGSKKSQIKLKSIKKSSKKDKKLMATFETNGRTKVIHFGANGMSDFTKHHDRERRARYIKRHSKDLRTGNPARAGYLSMFVLWNKPSLQASIADYKRRLSVYNKTGKFPSKIK